MKSMFKGNYSLEEKLFMLTKIEGYFFEKDTFLELVRLAKQDNKYVDKLEWYLRECKNTISYMHESMLEIDNYTIGV